MSDELHDELGGHLSAAVNLLACFFIMAEILVDKLSSKVEQKQKLSHSFGKYLLIKDICKGEPPAEVKKVLNQILKEYESDN